MWETFGAGSDAQNAPPAPTVSSGRSTLRVSQRSQRRRPDSPTRGHRLGRVLRQRDADVLACFDRPGTGNAPTEAINGARSNTSAAPHSGCQI